MKIEDIKKYALEHGCEIVKEGIKELVASCDDGNIFLLKNPESRMKVLLRSDELKSISDYLSIPKSIEPSEIKIGKFNLQGPWSRKLEMGKLDRVEIVFNEKDLEKSSLKKISDPMKRIKRANNFPSLYDDDIDPFAIIKKEVNKIGDYLVDKIEDKISIKSNNEVICGKDVVFQRSWNDMDKEKYRFIVKVECRVPILKDTVMEKINHVGGWRIMSETDMLYIKSVVTPSKDAFLTGIKVKSMYGDNRLEFELLDENKIKKKEFLDGFRDIELKGKNEIIDQPVSFKKVVPDFVPFEEKDSS